MRPDGASEAGAATSAPLEAASGERLRELELELQRERARARDLEAQVALLNQSLAASEERRIEREREWLEYQSLLGLLSPERLPGGKPFGVELSGVEPTPGPGAGPGSEDERPLPTEAQLAAQAERALRSKAIEKSLRTLLALEDVRALDLLECGLLEGDAIGPVVFRLLDGRGRLAGSLYAERMRLEASRSARTITLVLESGYETRGGERFPFDDTPRRAQGAGAADPASGEGEAEVEAKGTGRAARRVVLEGIDPLSWADDFRELFGAAGLDLSGDDGLWDLGLVRARLNELLKRDSSSGIYRLRELGGVQEGVLLRVHLERLDSEGGVERRLFADRLRLSAGASGVELELSHGVQVRGQDQRVPFLDGRYRVLLPGADTEAWVRAGLPGLSPAPAAAGSSAPPAPADRD
ncbi:MAG: hypothetical protein IPK67_11420 [Planctomycetes bacterium]|nr:hypothetical protein [Planctomycetota bacterium]